MIQRTGSQVLPSIVLVFIHVVGHFARCFPFCDVLGWLGTECSWSQIPSFYASEYLPVPNDAKCFFIPVPRINMFTHVHPFTPIRSNRYLLDSDVDPNFHPILVFQLPGHRLGSGPAIFLAIWLVFYHQICGGYT